MAPATQAAPTLADDIARVFALQQAHQWDVKASSADQRKAKLAKLKAAVEGMPTTSSPRCGRTPASLRVRSASPRC